MKSRNELFKNSTSKSPECSLLKQQRMCAGNQSRSWESCFLSSYHCLDPKSPWGFESIDHQCPSSDPSLCLSQCRSDLPGYRPTPSVPDCPQAQPVLTYQSHPFLSCFLQWGLAQSSNPDMGGRQGSVLSLCAVASWELSRVGMSELLVKTNRCYG